MTTISHPPSTNWCRILIAVALLVVIALGAVTSSVAELSPGSPELIEPQQLLKVLDSPSKPIVLFVGPKMMYAQAHIRGAEFIGGPARPEYLEALRKRLATLPKSSFIVLYCGCCPWEHCPNIQPAYKEAKAAGFTNAKVLYLPTSFGVDWVDKGYPVVKGQ